LSKQPGIWIAPWPGLSLAPEDNELIRFWRYVVAALRQFSPHYGETAQSMLEENQAPAGRNASLPACSTI
jgi:ATP/maltotriose-dependent transcriptional regulator MalT